MEMTEPTCIQDEYHLEITGGGISFAIRARDYKGGQIVVLDCGEDDHERK